MVQTSPTRREYRAHIVGSKLDAEKLRGIRPRHIIVLMTRATPGDVRNYVLRDILDPLVADGAVMSVYAGGEDWSR
jgi:hypothetical protein